MSSGVITITGEETGPGLEHAKFIIDRRALINILGLAQAASSSLDLGDDREIRQSLGHAVEAMVKEGLGKEMRDNFFSQAWRSAKAQLLIEKADKSLSSLRKRVKDEGAREADRLENEVSKLQATLSNHKEVQKEALKGIDDVQKSLGQLHGEDNLMKVNKEIASIHDKANQYADCARNKRRRIA
jgi:hypothetical protein